MKQKIANIESYNVANTIVPEHKLAFMDWNESASNTVVCMHGLISNSRDFDYLAERLASDFRIISIDIPGRGDSDWFEDKSLYQYPVYIADILALLKSLNISQVDWIGTSMGGVAGMSMAADYPNMIRSLVLNDIGPEIPGKALAKMRKYVGMSPAFQDLAMAKRHLQMIYKNFGVVDDEHWNHLVQHTTYIDKDKKYMLKYDPQIAETFLVNQENPEDIIFWDLWDKITCPTLLIHGTQSDILLQSTVDKMETRHNMDTYKMYDVGHAPALVDDEEIEHIYQWLTR